MKMWYNYNTLEKPIHIIMIMFKVKQRINYGIFLSLCLRFHRWLGMVMSCLLRLLFVEDIHLHSSFSAKEKPKILRIIYFECCNYYTY